MLTFWLSLLLMGAQDRGADFTCVVERIPEAERKRIGAEIISSRPSQEVDQPLVAAMDACKVTADGKGAVAVAVLSSFGAAEARTRLAGVGIDSRHIDTWFDGLSPAQQDSVIGNEQLLVQLSERLIERGVKETILDAHAELVGAYIGTRAVIGQLGRAASQ